MSNVYKLDIMFDFNFFFSLTVMCYSKIQFIVINISISNVLDVCLFQLYWMFLILTVETNKPLFEIWTWTTTTIFSNAINTKFQLEFFNANIVSYTLFHLTWSKTILLSYQTEYWLSKLIITLNLLFFSDFFSDFISAAIKL